MRKMLFIAAATFFMMPPADAFSQAEATGQPPLEEIAPSYDEDFGLADDPSSEPRSHSAFGEDEAPPPAAADAPPPAEAPAPSAPPAEAAIPAIEWSGEPQTPE